MHIKATCSLCWLSLHALAVLHFQLATVQYYVYGRRNVARTSVAWAGGTGGAGCAQPTLLHAACCRPPARGAASSLSGNRRRCCVIYIEPG